MNDKELLQFLYHAMKLHLAQSPDMIFFKDLDLRYVAGSKGFFGVAGDHGSDDILGMTDYDFFSKELAEKYIEDDHRMLETGEAIIDELEFIPNEEGGFNYASTSKYPVRDAEGKVIGLYGHSRDITAEILLEEEKERGKISTLLYDDVLEANITQNRMIGVRGRVWAQVMDGIEKHSFLDAVQHAMRWIHPDHQQAFQEAYSTDRLLSLFQSGVRGFDHITYMTKNGTDYEWVSFLSQLHRAKTTDCVHLVSFLRNHDQEMKLQQQLKHKADTDFLTGLYNRHFLFERIEQILNETEEGHKHALLFLDLDNFKHINDHYGHVVGDRILKETGTRLQELCRETDLVGRIGGDEFLLLISNIASKHDVRGRVLEMMDTLRAYWHSDQDVAEVTYSVGVAFSTPNKAFEQLYDEADRQMYCAKRAGRNQVVFGN